MQLFSLVNLSHANLILRPARRTQKGRVKIPSSPTVEQATNVGWRKADGGDEPPSKENSPGPSIGRRGFILFFFFAVFQIL